MANSWIQHVRAYAAKHKISYWEAMRRPDMKSSYVKTGGSAASAKIACMVAKNYDKFNVLLVNNPSKNLRNRQREEYPEGNYVAPVRAPVQVAPVRVAPVHVPEPEPQYDDYNAGEFQEHVQQKKKKNKVSKAVKEREAAALALEKAKQDELDRRQDLLDDLSALKTDCMEYKKQNEIIDNNFNKQINELKSSKLKKSVKSDMQENIITNRNVKVKLLNKQYVDLRKFMKSNKVDDINSAFKLINQKIKSI